MFAKLNAFVEAFMEKAGDMGYCRWDEIMSEWRDLKNQQELETIFKTVKKRKKRKKRKKKDKDAPKRGRSAYIYFCSKNRADAKKKSGDGATLGQVGKELGLMWTAAKLNKEISEYEKLAKADKVRYQREMADYVPPSDEELEEQQSKKSKRKRKRGLSAYMIFCKNERATINAELPDLHPNKVMSELGKRWREAKKGDISKWNKLAKKSKAEAAEANAAASTDDDEKPKSEEAASTDDDEKAKKAKKPKTKKPKSEEAASTDDEKAKTKDEDEDEDELIEENKPLWKIKVDSTTGKTYYYNTKTRKPQWNKPDEMDDEEAKAPAPKKKNGKRIYAYAFWVTQHRTKIGEDTSLKGKKLTKELSKRWKALSKEEKAEWKTKAVAESEA